MWVNNGDSDSALTFNTKRTPNRENLLSLVVRPSKDIF